jgi:hypothetical protein
VLPCFGLCGLRLGQQRDGGVALNDGDILTGGGAGEEDTLQRDAAQDASVQVGVNGGEVGGAETGGDGVEAGSGGALADGVDQMTAVAEQITGDVEEAGNVAGQSGGGGILRGIRRHVGLGSGGDVLHWERS